VLAGLDWAAAQGADTIVTAAADTPFFPCDLVPMLSLATEGMAHPLALAATPDPERGHARHPTFGLWPVALRGDLRDALHAGVRKVVQWTQAHEARMAVFPDEAAFFNVNTPADLARAEAML
jgi:molybdopterin-guanine dinucleotide biosynthesis protein A